MPTFGSALWGGGGSGGSGTVGVPLTDIIMPAYRIAGITQRARITPSPEMFAEAVPELNRMVGSFNIDGRKIYTTSIAAYALTAGQKIFSIGPGGDFDAARPVFIRRANILLPTSPVVRWPVRILDDDEWSRIAVQDIPGAPPYQLYYDGSFDDSGRGSIYLRFQAPDGYQLELYTWQSLKDYFTDENDVLVAPPGYSDLYVYSLAERLADMNPGMSNMLPTARARAAQLRANMTIANSRSPKMDPEAGLCGADPGPGRGWLDGSIR